MKIGIVGEYPTDVNAISVILGKQFPNVEFFTLIRGVHGSNLEEPAIKHKFRREYQFERPDYVLFVRDLDSPETDRAQLAKRKAYFAEFNRVVDRKGLYLLNIQELEALLLTDVNILNNHYNASLEIVEDCMRVVSPKEYIKTRINGYSTGHNVKLLAKYPFETLVNNCRYFGDFIRENGHCFTNMN